MKLLRILLLFSISFVNLHTRASETYQGVELATEGAWCWFADPRAIHYESEDGTINASYIGYIDVHGNIKATQFDFLTGQRTDVLVRSYFQPDDHDNPTFLVLPDERILIIYSRHTDEAAFYYRVSVHPGDITILGEEKKIVTADNTTYPSPYILSDDPDHFYLCWRGISWHPTIAKFTMPDDNDNVTCEWGPYQMVQSTGSRPYAKYYSNGKDKIYFTYTTGHPDNESPNWIYMNVVNINATNNSDGSITTTPTLEDITGNELSTIANGAFNVNKTSSYLSSYPNTVVDNPSSYRDWVWQIVNNSDGNPVIAMVRINSGKTQHEYCYAKWTGNEWKITDLADGGGRFHASNTEYCYSGGEAIDPENPNIIYLSIPTEGTFGEIYELWKYTLDENGDIINKEQLTTNSQKNNVRPYILPDSENSGLRLTWMHGDYYYWIVTTSYPLGFPTAIHMDYEWEESSLLPADISTTNFESLSMNSSEIQTIQLEASNSEDNTNFTVNINMEFSSSEYYGTIFSCDAFTVGLDQTTVLPYISIGNDVFYTSNVFYTSDNWANHSTGTSGDYWPTTLSQFNITIVVENNIITIYRNGYIDFCIETDENITQPTNISVGGFSGTLYSTTVTTEALTSAQVMRLLQEETLNNIIIPETICTDIVLPESSTTGNITWESDNTEIIATDGTFNAPEVETPVTITATIGNISRSFNVTTLPRNIQNNLIAHYDFESEHTYTVNGTTYVTDLSGQSGDLCLMGSATTDGTLNLTSNSATSFSTNGYAIAPSVVMDSLRSYTVAFIAHPSSLTNAPRFYDFGYGSANSLFFRANTLAAGIKYQGGTTTMVSASSSLNTDTEYKLAVTFNAGTQTTTIYVDGEVVATGTSNVNEPYMIAADATCNRNYIGRTQWWDTSYASDNVDYVGTIDDFYMYNIALTATEIATIQGIRIEDESLNADCTEERIKNHDFEGSYIQASGTGVNSDRAIYQPESWTLVYTSGNTNDMTIMNYNCLSSENFASGLINEDTNGANAYLIRQKWGTSTIGITQQIDTLPAGIYRLETDLLQSGSGGSATINVSIEDIDEIETTTTNESSWQTAKNVFSTDGISDITITAKATHTSNGSEKFTGFDNFKLLNITANRSEAEILSLLTLMTEAADSLINIGGLNENTTNQLTTCNEKAKTADEKDNQETLFSYYEQLREAIRAALNPDNTTTITSITNNPTPKNGKIYNLNGQLINTDSSTKNLKRGIYIQNGKKFTSNNQ